MTTDSADQTAGSNGNGGSRMDRPLSFSESIIGLVACALALAAVVWCVI